MTKHMGRLITGAGIATLVAGFAGYTGIEAAVDTGNLAVSASVAAKCTISDGTLAFGTYDPVVNNATTALDQVGTVDVACTKGSSATVSLDLGTHTSGSTRRMQHGVTATEFLAYQSAHHRGPYHRLEHDQHRAVHRNIKGAQHTHRVRSRAVGPGRSDRKLRGYGRRDYYLLSLPVAGSTNCTRVAGSWRRQHVVPGSPEPWDSSRLAARCLLLI